MKHIVKIAVITGAIILLFGVVVWLFNQDITINTHKFFEEYLKITASAFLGFLLKILNDFFNRKGEFRQNKQLAQKEYTQNRALLKIKISQFLSDIDNINEVALLSRKYSSVKVALEEKEQRMKVSCESYLKFIEDKNKRQAILSFILMLDELTNPDLNVKINTFKKIHSLL